MFFIISKILVPFTQPLTYIILLLVVSFVWHKKPRLGKRCLLAAMLLLIIFGTPFVPDTLIRFLETRYPLPASVPHVDAVVVLTGMVDLELSTEQRIEFSDSVERIFAGIRMMKHGTADWLIIPGGSGDIYDQTTSEAVLLRQFAIEYGVPAEKILVDATSRNTYENAVNTKSLMHERQLSSLILVTTANHLPRAMGCFRKIGLEPIPYPVDYRVPPQPEYHLLKIFPSIAGLRNTTYILHEYIGLLMYKIAGYI